MKSKIAEAIETIITTKSLFLVSDKVINEVAITNIIVKIKDKIAVENRISPKKDFIYSQNLVLLNLVFIKNFIM